MDKELIDRFWARDAHGENQHAAKLTNAKVREIREFWAQKLKGVKELSNLYGVGITTIRYVIARKSWKHVN